MKQYHELLRHILDNGTRHEDRTGVGTISTFGYQTRFDLREAGDLGPVYGYLWRSFGGDYPTMNGIDQIARLIREIEQNPNSRRLIVTGWNPETCDEVALPP